MTTTYRQRGGEEKGAGFHFAVRVGFPAHFPPLSRGGIRYPKFKFGFGLNSIKPIPSDNRNGGKVDSESNQCWVGWRGNSGNMCDDYGE